MRDYPKNEEHLEEMLAFATLDQVYPLAEALIDHHHRTSCFKKNSTMFDNDYSSSEYRWNKALYCVYTWLGQKGFPIEELSFKRIIMEHMLLQGGYFEALSKEQLDELFSNNEDIDINNPMRLLYISDFMTSLRHIDSVCTYLSMMSSLVKQVSYYSFEHHRMEPYSNIDDSEPFRFENI